MLHQRTTRRQPGDIDPHDPTTTVYSSSGSNSGGYSGGNQAYGGYGGGGASAGPGYAGYGSSANGASSLYSDKGKKKKQFGFKNILQQLQNPLLIVSTIAFICFMFAVRYKLAHQHVHRNTKADIHSISRHRDDLQRELKTMKEVHKKQTLENKKFQSELMKIQKNKLGDTGGDSSNSKSAQVTTDALSKLETREKAWKKQYELLKDAVIKESRRSVIDKYGNPPYYCEFTVAIAILNKDDPEEGDYDEVIQSFTVEMAPLEEMPHAVHLFLEQVAHKLWDNGWFYLNGPHVFQAGPQVPDGEEYDIAMKKGVDERSLALKPFKELQLDSLAFPEYSDKFPHLPWTLGYTGRPGGPDFYINKVDNVKAHGPGGQTHHDLAELADPCFAKIIDGMDTVNTMMNSPTIRGQDDSHRFFFEEPVQIVKVRIVQHPSKVMDLNKIKDAIQNNQNSEGQQQHPATGKAEEGKAKLDDAAGRVEVEMGNVNVPEQGKPSAQDGHEEYHEYIHHNDEEHSEHHRSRRHRKYPKLSNLVPENTVEA